MKRLDDMFKSMAASLVDSAQKTEHEPTAEALRVVGEELGHAAAEAEGFYVIDEREADALSNAADRHELDLDPS